MSKEGNFLIYCAEQYKNAKKMNGRQLVAVFDKHDVWDYLYSCFEALHTTGVNYIVSDIDQYIADRQSAAN